MQSLRLGLLALLYVPLAAQAAFGLNGVALGASERDIQMAFPSAYCKPLEWESTAADRRCDDARVALGKAEVHVTFYLKKDAVQAFDVRFDTKDLKRVMRELKDAYGTPVAETKDVFARSGKEGKQIYRVRWEQGQDRAVLVVPLEKTRGQLTVSRGRFEEEIYRVR